MCISEDRHKAGNRWQAGCIEVRESLEAQTMNMARAARESSDYSACAALGPLYG